MHLGQLGLEQRVLLRRHVPAPGVGQRPRGPRRIVEQRLVPGPARVVHIHCERRRLQRREPVVVVRRVKQLQLQNRAPPVRIPPQPHAPPADRVLERRRPPVRPRHHLHPVRPQRVQLGHLLLPSSAGRWREAPEGRDQCPPPLLPSTHSPPSAARRRTAPAAPPRPAPGSADRAAAAGDAPPPAPRPQTPPAARSPPPSAIIRTQRYATAFFPNPSRARFS
jgi:hypothetical protein